jgi:hypothetical protein
MDESQKDAAGIGALLLGHPKQLAAPRTAVSGAISVASG